MTATLVVLALIMGAMVFWLIRQTIKCTALGRRRSDRTGPRRWSLFRAGCQNWPDRVSWCGHITVLAVLPAPISSAWNLVTGVRLQTPGYCGSTLFCWYWEVCFSSLHAMQQCVGQARGVKVHLPCGRPAYLCLHSRTAVGLAGIAESRTFPLWQPGQCLLLCTDSHTCIAHSGRALGLEPDCIQAAEQGRSLQGPYQRRTLYDLLALFAVGVAGIICTTVIYVNQRI